MARSIALAVGVGDSLSASVARQLHAGGHELVLAARNTDKTSTLAKQLGARVATCDAADRNEVHALMGTIDGPLRGCFYIPSYRQHGPLVDVDPIEVERSAIHWSRPLHRDTQNG